LGSFTSIELTDGYTALKWRAFPENKFSRRPAFCYVNIAVKEQFEQIREQIHEIRNFPGPLDLKLASLDYEIKRSRASLESKTAELESKAVANSAEIARHSEQIRQIREFLKMQ
jgi:hypothetical protein